MMAIFSGTKLKSQSKMKGFPYIVILGIILTGIVISFVAKESIGHFASIIVIWLIGIFILVGAAAGIIGLIMTKRKKKIWRVRKGFKRPLFSLPAIVELYGKTPAYEGIYSFTHDSLYYYGSDEDSKKQKLFGVSQYFNPRKRSWRFAFNCDIEDELIHIYAYTEIENLFGVDYLYSCKLGDIYKMRIEFERNFATKYIIYKYNIESDIWIELNSIEVDVSLPDKRNLYWKCHTYFDERLNKIIKFVEYFKN